MKPFGACIIVFAFLIAIGSSPVWSAQTYTLEDAGCGGDYTTDNAKFNINGDELRTSEVFDREIDTSFTICIRTTDDGSDTYDKVFTITVNNNADIIINEVDSDTSATDNLEYVELYAGVASATPLDGMTVVFFDGTTDTSYRAFDLDGFTTDANGYYVIGNPGVSGVDLTFPNGELQNGADAVALYADDAVNFPNGTSITTTNLLDALVYDTGQADDAGLLALLTGGGQINENQYSDGENDSMQRSPNGTGARRNTSSFDTFEPTPKDVNTNVAPAVSSIVRAGFNPTNAASVDFTVTFSEAVSGVDTGDFPLTTTGDAAGTVSNVIGSGNTRTVTVNSITGDGNLRLDLSDDDSITDSVDPLGGSGVQNYTFGENYTIDNTAPTVTAINRADVNPTAAASVDFTVTFGNSVSDIETGDFVLATVGTASGTINSVSAGSGTTVTVTVNGITGDGTLGLNFDFDALDSVLDMAGNAAVADFTGQTYSIDNTGPTVTINQAGGQADPATASPIDFTVVFDGPVVGFGNADIALSGTASPTTAVVTGAGPTYNVAVSGMTSLGTVIANINAGVVQDAVGNGNTAATFTDNQVTFNPPAPSVVSISRADANPTSAASVDFLVTFDQTVSGIDTADFALATTGTTGTISSVSAGIGLTVTVSVNTITGDGTLGLNVVDDDTMVNGINVPLGGVGAGNGDFTGQLYTIDRVAPGITSFTRQVPATSPTNVDTLIFQATFDENVYNVDTSDFTVNGATTAIISNIVEVTSNTVYNITVSGGDLAGFNGEVGINLAGSQNITDLLGNALPPGEPGTDQIYSLDNTGPPTPAMPDMTSATDTGEFNTDNNTRDNTPTFTGTAASDSTITLISSQDGDVGTTIADGSGNWTITASVLANGAHNITVTATDELGNTSAASSALAINIDIGSPVISGMPVDIITNTDPGLNTAIVSWIEPTANDVQDGPITPVLTGGLASGSPFPIGIVTVDYTATDSAGNSSIASFTVTVVQNEFPWLILLPGLVSPNKVSEGGQ